VPTILIFLLYNTPTPGRVGMQQTSALRPWGLFCRPYNGHAINPPTQKDDDAKNAPAIAQQRQRQRDSASRMPGRCHGRMGESVPATCATTLFRPAIQLLKDDDDDLDVSSRKEEEQKSTPPTPHLFLLASVTATQPRTSLPSFHSTLVQGRVRPELQSSHITQVL
jgi:hypothetical protein